MGINIGVGVLNLSETLQVRRNHLITLGSQVNEHVVLDVSLGELLLMGVPRVGVPKYGMAVPWNNLTTLDGLLDHSEQLIVGGGVSKLFSDFDQPSEHFLVGEAVKRAGQTVDGGRVTEVGVGEGGRHQVAGVS